MTEDKNEIEQQAETFTDGLSDEALDREEGIGRGYSFPWGHCR